MKIEDMRNYTLLASSLFLIDRLTKHVVIYNLPHYQVHQFLNIDLVFNRGMSFGIFHSQDAMIFTVVNIIIGLVIAFLVIHTHMRILSRKLIIGEIFIFVGAMSNVIDRCMYGGVVDFIALSYQQWHFAVFNIADMFIFCGVMLMLFLEYRESWKKC